jgi:hypothetical protein
LNILEIYLEKRNVNMLVKESKDLIIPMIAIPKIETFQGIETKIAHTGETEIAPENGRGIDQGDNILSRHTLFIMS